MMNLNEANALTMLELDNERLENKLAIAVEALMHYADELSGSEDLYLDIFDLIETRNGNVIGFDSDTFAKKAKQALQKIKEN